MRRKSSMATVFGILMATVAFAQQEIETEKKVQWSILFGLNQPILLRGFNVEANYWTKKFVFDYSHGFGLHLDGEFVGGDIKQQQLDLKVTHSLGIGVGYRFTKGFNLRLEPKLHLFEVYYKGEEQNEAARITDYSTFTLGVGAYYRWLPFEKKANALKGITVAPSVRYWPNVSSTLTGDKFSYSNKLTGQTETHEAVSIGAANTPWIVNISVGYTFR
jgi:opacity protein-like surface antigen